MIKGKKISPVSDRHIQIPWTGSSIRPQVELFWKENSIINKEEECFRKIEEMVEQCYDNIFKNMLGDQLGIEQENREMPVFDKVSQNVTNFSNSQSLKKSLEEKKQEKAKIFGYIGMEIYDLYKAQKLSAPELDIYFEKLAILEKEAAEIEEKMAQIAGTGKNVCSCGKQVRGDMSFCPYCGNKLKGISGEPVQMVEKKTAQKEEKFLECVCGAKVPVGQFMCMECGRKVGN